MARLRRLALEDAGALSMTPAALIQADREKLKIIIDEGAPDRFSTSDEWRALLRAQKPLRPNLSYILVALALCSTLLLAIVPDSLVALKLIGAFMSVLCVGGLFCVQHIGAEYLSRVKLAVLRGAKLVPSEDKLDLQQGLYELIGLLESAQERESLIADFSKDVLLKLDCELRILCTNPASYREWGVIPTELMSQCLLQYVPDSQHARLKAAFADSQRRGVASSVETSIHVDPTVHDVQWIVEWSETDKEFFVIARDITSSKSAERARRQLMTFATHDLKSPMMAIKSTLRMLTDGLYGPLSDVGKMQAEAAHRTGDYVCEMVNDLLDIDKIQAGSFSIRKQEFCVTDLLEESIRFVSPISDLYDIKIELITGSLPEQIMGDEAALKRVLVNLLSNALKFSPRKSCVTLQASIDEHRLTLSVKDSGRGISQSDINRIFDLWQQVEPEDATLCGGTGIGLAICKTIVEAHGGTIRVLSTPGHGSEFLLELPCSSILLSK